MKRAVRSVLAVILVFSVFPLFALSDAQEYFMAIEDEFVYPVESTLGLVSDYPDSEAHSALYSALTSPFDFDWTETWFEESMKSSLSSVFSPVLSEILPAGEFLMSRSRINADSSCSINVRFKDGKIMTFTLIDSKIVGLK